MTAFEANEQVILVDSNDLPLGQASKEIVHLKGMLHRAISVFIFNSKGQLLLQRRARDKYHSGGLWTNSCCSHPRPGEDTLMAAKRRLEEEMGIQADLCFTFSFLYKTEFENGLIEHEFDHVFFGTSDQTPEPNPKEVEAWKYAKLDELCLDVQENPSLYTSWFKICMNEVIQHLQKQKRA